MAKVLAKILKPLVGKSPHHINSTQDFVEQGKHITLEPGECRSSYDVSSLFTSVPVDPALNIIKDLLEKDHTLKERTVMAVSDIILLLDFCLMNTYFSFQDQFYEQVGGAAMDCPVSPIVANLYMEYLQQKALSTAPNPPASGTVYSGGQPRRMGPSPSWTPLLNLRLMVHYYHCVQETRTH